MKYIKRYNEAIGPKLTRREWVEFDKKGQEIMATQSVLSPGIDPETLRRAGSLASNALQTDKAEALRDYADVKQHGYYNMTVLRNGGTNVKGIKVTNFNITNIQYGVTKKGQSSLQLSGGTADDIINRWKGKDWLDQGSFNGDRLGLTFDVSVKILNSGKSDLRSKGGQQFETLVKQYSWIPFSMSLIISSYTHGMKDFLTCDSCSGSGTWDCYECGGTGEVWDDAADDNVPCRDCEGKPASDCEDCSGRGFVSVIWKDGQKIPIERDENGNPIYDAQAFFEDTKTCRLEMSPKDISPGEKYIGIFSDKMSANQFAQDLPEIISRSGQLRQKLSDLLGILSHDPSKDLKEIMDSLKNVSNNNIFPQNPKAEATFYNQFFYRNIIGNPKKEIQDNNETS